MQTENTMHVFFDLDGTLTDPKVGIVNCYRFAMSNLGLEIDPDIKLESYIGPPMRSAFKELCGDAAYVEQAVDLYRKRFSTIGLFENQVYDGIFDCLDQVSAKADNIYVVTSKPTVYSVRIIEHFNLNRYFKVVFGSNLDGTLSDKTELIEHVLNSENILPKEAVMIGDRKFDMVGAKNNGIRALGVLWGYGTEEELQCAGADALCGHPNEIHDQLFT